MEVEELLEVLVTRLKEHENIASSGSNRTREKYRARADELSYVIGKVKLLCQNYQP